MLNNFVFVKVAVTHLKSGIPDRLIKKLKITLFAEFVCLQRCTCLKKRKSIFWGGFSWFLKNSALLVTSNIFQTIYTCVVLLRLLNLVFYSFVWWPLLCNCLISAIIVSCFQTPSSDKCLHKLEPLWMVPDLTVERYWQFIDYSRSIFVFYFKLYFFHAPPEKAVTVVNPTSGNMTTAAPV